MLFFNYSPHKSEGSFIVARLVSLPWRRSILCMNACNIKNANLCQKYKTTRQKYVWTYVACAYVTNPWNEISHRRFAVGMCHVRFSCLTLPKMDAYHKAIVLIFQPLMASYIEDQKNSRNRKISKQFLMLFEYSLLSLLYHYIELNCWFFPWNNFQFYFEFGN